MLRLVVGTALFLLASWAHAQETPAPVPAARTLADALPWLRWDAARRGVFLVVEAAKRPPANGQPLPPPPTENGYSAAELGKAFLRQPVTMGGVTALVPSTMTLLNTEFPTKPDLYDTNHRVERLLSNFLATLKPEQWRQITANGIALSDLRTETQKRLFQALLPNPLTIQKRGKELRTLEVKADDARLSDTQRNQTRLRLNADTSYYIDLSAVQKSGAKGWASVGWRRGWAYSSPFSVSRNRRFGPPDESYFGQSFRTVMPNRAKPSELDYAALVLQTNIPLAGIQTVGDLVRRIAATTQVELYADSRLAPRLLTLRGEKARAGDLLKAVALAVCGTYRKVGTAFVLTNDLQGLTARALKIADHFEGLMREERKLVESDDAEFKKAIRVTQPARLLTPAPEDFFNPGSVMYARILTAALGVYDGTPDDLIVPLSELPAAFQEQVKTVLPGMEQEDAALGERQRFERITAEKVRLQRSSLLHMCWVVPGYGALPDAAGYLGSVYDLKPTPEQIPVEPILPITASFALPSRLGIRALHIAPSTVEEAMAAAQEAKLRGITQLWLNDVPGTPLVDLVQAAKRAAPGLSVYAVMPLLEAEPDAPPETLDIAVTGETGRDYARRVYSDENPDRSLAQRGYIRVDDSAAMARLFAKCKRIAQTPGLDGMALCETSAPGYNTDAQQEDDYAPWGGLGYTVSNRLAFLRETGCDPIDVPISGGELFGNVNLPYFPYRSAFWPNPGEADTVRQRWQTFRREQNRRALTRFYAEIHGENTNLPIRVGVRSESDNTHHFAYINWDTADALPSFDSRAMFRDEKKMPYKSALFVVPYRDVWLRPSGHGVAEPMVVRPAPNIEFAALLENSAYELNKSKWDGVLIDLSAVSFARALKLLEGLAVVPSQPQTKAIQ